MGAKMSKSLLIGLAIRPRNNFGPCFCAAEIAGVLRTVLQQALQRFGRRRGLSGKLHRKVHPGLLSGEIVQKIEWLRPLPRGARKMKEVAGQFRSRSLYQWASFTP
jgi:hypothetical protein